MSVFYNHLWWNLWVEDSKLINWSDQFSLIFVLKLRISKWIQQLIRFKVQLQDTECFDLTTKW